MKKIILLLISIVLLGCGNRTKKTEKEKTTISGSENTSQSETISAKSSSEAQTDLNQYMKQSGLKINSTGKPYTLQYNGVVFSGDANLEFSDKEEKTIVKTITKTLSIIETKTTYKTETTYKSIYNKNAMDLKSKRDSWWLYVLISIVSIVVGIYIWENFIKSIKNPFKK